jgi:hypothetical protein
MSDAIRGAHREIARQNVRREELRRSKFERQKAIAEFPLKVALIAADMQQLTQIGHVPITPAIQEFLDYCERQIREIFIQDFGRDMVQGD